MRIYFTVIDQSKLSAIQSQEDNEFAMQLSMATNQLNRELSPMLKPLPDHSNHIHLQSDTNLNNISLIKNVEQTFHTEDISQDIFENKFLLEK